MIVLPYQTDVYLKKIPWVTITVMIVCTAMFWQQYSSERAYSERIMKYCYSVLDRSIASNLERVFKRDGRDVCLAEFEALRESDDADLRLRQYAERIKKLRFFDKREDEVQYIYSSIEEGYRGYVRYVPKNVTRERWYNPQNIEFVKMFTASFSHGDWAHLIFNLLFFYVFATSVEVVLGALSFSLIIALMCLTTSLAYSYGLFGVAGEVPTVGLSGVVMGMMAMLAIIMPSVKVRCFFWFLIIIRTFSIPAVIIAVCYIGLDVMALNENDATDNTNYVAHVSGAATGGFIALCYHLFASQFLKRRVREYC